MTDITEPGIHPNFDIEEYHADPCPTPSLSGSIAKICVHECMRKAWAKHPRLGKSVSPPEDHDDKFSIGTACHTLLFERGKGLVELDFKNWQTNASKDARAKAVAAGNTPILSRHLRKAEKMQQSIIEQLQLHEQGPAFFAGNHNGFEVRDEVAIFWTEDIDGVTVWCRALIDRLAISRERIVVFDLKSTSNSAAPHEISRMMFNMHYQMQAAMIMRGLQKLINTPVADRLEVHFIVAETDEPHLVTVGQARRAMFILGAKQVAQAVGLWARSQATGNWPGYPRTSVDLFPPSYVETKWLEREVSDPSLINVENDPFMVASPWIPREMGRINFDDVDPS